MKNKKRVVGIILLLFFLNVLYQLLLRSIANKKLKSYYSAEVR